MQGVQPIEEPRTRAAADTAFAAVFRAHYSRVLAFAARRITDRETAREIAADVFRIAWASFDPHRPPTAAWLLAVARNRVGDAYRRRAREERLLEDLRDRVRPVEVRDDRVREVLAAMPDAAREVLMLTYWDGLRAAEAAAVLGTTTAAVWVRLHRARRAFASEWERQETT